MKRIVQAGMGALFAAMMVGCVSISGGELDKATEDRLVALGAVEAADKVLSEHPEYIADIAAVEGFVRSFRHRVRNEEVASLDSALRNCKCSILEGGTEADRVDRFRQLYKFKNRVDLREGYRFALSLDCPTVHQ